jgi:hypothetical protein
VVGVVPASPTLLPCPFSPAAQAAGAR